MQPQQDPELQAPALHTGAHSWLRPLAALLSLVTIIIMLLATGYVSDPATRPSPWNAKAIRASAAVPSGSGGGTGVASKSGSEKAPSEKATKNDWCPFASLPGTWSSRAALGNHWTLFDHGCKLQNLLPVYAPAQGGVSAASAKSSTAASSSNDSQVPPASRLPTAGVLFLSDSVDKHVLEYLCQYAGGTVKSVVSKTAAKLDPDNPANISSYAVHTCVSQTGLRLVATYFPGVHPTGPYHRQVKMNYKLRIDHAVSVWKSYSEIPPDIVVVASTLWDLARMYYYEPDLVAGAELSLSLLEDWIRNYTAVVQYAKQNVPQAKMYAHHTTMFPRFNPETGLMERPYLGRRVFIRQLNAAGRHAASQLGLEVIDYEVIGTRFLEGQKYLGDLIHPGQDVSLEVANIYLNYVQQLKGMAAAGVRHPSTTMGMRTPSPASSGGGSSNSSRGNVG